MYQETRKKPSTGLQVMPRFRGYEEEEEEPEAENEGMDTKERKTHLTVGTKFPKRKENLQLPLMLLQSGGQKCNYRIQ